MANRMILNETALFGRGAVGALTDEVKLFGYPEVHKVLDKAIRRQRLMCIRDGF